MAKPASMTLVRFLFLACGVTTVSVTAVAIRASSSHPRTAAEALKIVKPPHAKNKLAMAAPPRVLAAWDAVAATHRVEGDIVELGVFRGGTSMMMAYAELARVKNATPTRTLWLYDTFEGLPPPTTNDDARSKERWAHAATGENIKNVKEQGGAYVDSEGRVRWNYAQIDEVRENMLSTGYPGSKMQFVKGKVEDTLKNSSNLPSKISVLRLDTDWYESTKVELEVLFPLLQSGGYLLIDDYCSWGGSRKATDEWAEKNIAKLKSTSIHGLHWNENISKDPLCFMATKT